jgi:hypothetical protein
MLNLLRRNISFYAELHGAIGHSGVPENSSDVPLSPTGLTSSERRFRHFSQNNIFYLYEI